MTPTIPEAQAEVKLSAAQEEAVAAVLVAVAEVRDGDNFASFNHAAAVVRDLARKVAEEERARAANIATNLAVEQATRANTFPAGPSHHPQRTIHKEVEAALREVTAAIRGAR